MSKAAQLADIRTMNSGFNPIDTSNVDGIIMGDLA